MKRKQIQIQKRTIKRQENIISSKPNNPVVNEKTKIINGEEFNKLSKDVQRRYIRTGRLINNNNSYKLSKDDRQIYIRTGRLGNRIQNNNNLINFIPILENKQPISIIVTAFQAKDYIEECLDSIENQTYFNNNDNFEVLVGIDGCQETLNKLIEIRSKYRNLRIFMMKKNVGTFITTNTLINLMKTDNFLRFDSDDIMLPQMINEIMYFANNYDVIKFSYYNFNNNGFYKLKNDGNPYAAGAIFFKKRVFDIYGGYQPWVCTAEGEILVRIGNELKIKNIDIGLFNRRIHSKSLTQNNKTGMQSELRKKYHKLIEISRQKKIKLIERISSEYYEYE